MEHTHDGNSEKEIVVISIRRVHTHILRTRTSFAPVDINTKGSFVANNRLRT
jgi:hypothetical protein